MKERPILFNGAMVRALLAGTKTQTRRVVKPQPRRVDGGVPFGDAPAWAHAEPGSAMMRCPYGKPGDWLWVRESWKHIEGGNVYDAAGGVMDSFEPETLYRASRPNYPGQWKPSIHMPRWASRITLEITSVRVERLQDISEADAIAEGVYTDPASPAYDAYAQLWDEINGPGSWAANPWVWVLEFRRLNVEHSQC